MKITHHLLLIRTLEHERDRISFLLGLHGYNVVVSSTSEDFRHAAEIHSHGELSVASKLIEAVGVETDADQGHVTVVHGLQRDPRVAAFPVGLIKKILETL
jgi:hypothetical protein